VITPTFFTWPAYDYQIQVFDENKLANSVYLDMLARNIFCLYQALGLGAPIMRVSNDFTSKLSNKIIKEYKS
jgi:hypothetical protein